MLMAMTNLDDKWQCSNWFTWINRTFNVDPGIHTAGNQLTTKLLKKTVENQD